MDTCPSCGSSVGRKAAYCPECGANLAGVPRSPDVGGTAGRALKKLGSGLLVIAAAITVIAFTMAQLFPNQIWATGADLIDGFRRGRTAQVQQGAGFGGSDAASSGEGSSSQNEAIGIDCAGIGKWFAVRDANWQEFETLLSATFGEDEVNRDQIPVLRGIIEEAQARNASALVPAGAEALAGYQEEIYSATLDLMDLMEITRAPTDADREQLRQISERMQKSLAGERTESNALFQRCDGLWGDAEPTQPAIAEMGAPVTKADCAGFETWGAADVWEVMFDPESSLSSAVGTLEREGLDVATGGAPDTSSLLDAESAFRAVADDLTALTGSARAEQAFQTGAEAYSRLADAAATLATGTSLKANSMLEAQQLNRSFVEQIQAFQGCLEQ